MKSSETSHISQAPHLACVIDISYHYSPFHTSLRSSVSCYPFCKLHKEQWTASFQPTAEPKKSLREIVVLTLRSLDLLRPRCKILLAGDRHCNIEISNHFLPQVWTLPDGECGPEQDVVVAAFSKCQVYVKLRALPILLSILWYSAAVAVLKPAGEFERLPEGQIIPTVLHVVA